MNPNKQQILNYDILSSRYINATGETITEGDLVCLDSLENGRVLVKFPDVIGAQLIFGVALAESRDGQPVQLGQYGIVNIKVDNSNGAISAGDKLTAKGGNAGIAVKWTPNASRSLIAFAMEDSDSATSELIIAKMLFNVSEAILPAGATGSGTDDKEFTIGQSNWNTDVGPFTLYFGNQNLPTESYIKWDGTYVTFGGDVKFDGSAILAFDNIITLNADCVAVDPTENCGIEAYRGTQTTAQLLWVEGSAPAFSGSWKCGLEGDLKRILTEDDIGGGTITWPSAVAGDILRGKAGGGNLELYSVGANTQYAVLNLNSSSLPEWTQFEKTSSQEITIGTGLAIGDVGVTAKILFGDYGVSRKLSVGTGSTTHRLTFESEYLGVKLRVFTEAGYESETDLYQCDGYKGNVFSSYVTNNTVANAYSVYISAVAKTGTGTATNLYGLYVEEPTGATNNYSAYFEGNVKCNSYLTFERINQNTVTFGIANVSNATTLKTLRFGDYNTNSKILADGDGLELHSEEYDTDFEAIISKSVRIPDGIYIDRSYSVTLDSDEGAVWNKEERASLEIDNEFLDTSLHGKPDATETFYGIKINSINSNNLVDNLILLNIGVPSGFTGNGYSLYVESTGKSFFGGDVEASTQIWFGNTSSTGLRFGSYSTSASYLNIYSDSGTPHIVGATNKSIHIETGGTGIIALGAPLMVKSIANVASEPLSASVGEIWYNVDTKHLRGTDNVGKKTIAFQEDLTDHLITNVVYTDLTQTIVSNKSFYVPAATNTTNYVGTSFRSDINSGVTVSSSLKVINIEGTVNDGDAGLTNFYSLFIASTASADWGAKKATNAYGLYVEQPTISTLSRNAWAGYFKGRVCFDDTAITTTLDSGYASFEFSTSQTADISSAGISSTIKSIGPTNVGAGNASHIASAIYTCAGTISSAQNYGLYSDGDIRIDGNVLVNMGVSDQNLTLGAISYKSANRPFIYVDSTSADDSLGGGIFLSPTYNIADGNEAFVGIIPFYSEQGKNTSTGLKVWSIGTGNSYISLLKPSTGSSDEPNDWEDAKALSITRTSVGATFNLNDNLANQQLIFQNTDSTYIVNVAFEGGLRVGSTSVVDEKYLILSEYGTSPSKSNAGALWYDSATTTLKTQVTGGGALTKELEFKLSWILDDFIFYDSTQLTAFVSTSTEYDKNDMVSYSGSYYVCSYSGGMAAIPAWSSTVVYHNGSVVKESGKYYVSNIVGGGSFGNNGSTFSVQYESFGYWEELVPSNSGNSGAWTQLPYGQYYDIQSTTSLDTTKLPADTNCITFLIQNAGSQLNGIDYTVTLLTGYASVNFESSLQTQIITSCAGGLLAYIQIAYPTRDNVV